MSSISSSRVVSALRRVGSFLAVILMMGLPLQAQPQLPGIDAGGRPGPYGLGAPVIPAGDAGPALPIGDPAHTPGKARRQLSLDEILAKHYEAVGGDRRRQVQSTKMSGTSAVMGMEAPFTRWTKRPNKIILEIYVQEMTGSQAFDGETAWWFMPFMGQAAPEEMPAEMALQMREGADFDGPLIDAAAKGNVIELLGTERVGMADAFKLKVTLPTGGVQTHWLDAETFRTLRVQTAGQDALFKAYQTVDGFPVAKLIEISSQMGAQTIYIETVEFNVPLEDAKFRMQ